MSNLFQAAVNAKNKIDVFVNDQTSPLFQYFLQHEQKTDITLTSAVSVDDTTINVSAGHGFTGADGEYLTIFEDNMFLSQPVISAVGDAITIAMPSDRVYTTAAVVIRGNSRLNIDGATTPTRFDLNLRGFTIPIDISKIVLTMTHTSAGDDGKFGGIAKLANGVYFRKENGFTFNLGNYINNQAFKDIGALIDYTAKGPAGVESTNIYVDLKQIFGQVIRMDSRANDVFYGYVREDLTGLLSFSVSLIGSYTDEL